MASIEEPIEKEKTRKEKKEKPKNLLDCKIACVAKRSRLNPFIKRTRIRSINVFELELPEYQTKSYSKKIICPKCMSNVEITVRPKKASLFYYKLILILYALVFLILNAWSFQQGYFSSDLNTLLEINAGLLGIAVVLLILELLNTYIKTRSTRPIRLKIKGKSNMAHKAHRSKRKEMPKKPIPTN